MKVQNYEIWFLTGSQYLYGEETLRQVAEHSQAIVNDLNEKSGQICKLVYKPVLKSTEEILQVCQEASSNPNCAGVIAWMHTFSPAKMWINGLKVLSKPLLHLHTQFNAEIPWSEIDMDFMNLNQSAHGDREFGHIISRMRKGVKVVVGHWQDIKVQKRIDTWMRVATAWADAQGMKIARFGDNMNNVAVTDGDKVNAEYVLGYHVDYMPIGNLVEYINKVEASEVDALVGVYNKEYAVAEDAQAGGEYAQNVWEAARLEIAIRRILEDGGYKAFTTNFDALHGMHQLPGLAAQRLMDQGYGFGAEGDWKTAALLRTMKVMANGLEGGTSFMEDYTYHFKGEDSAILQAHMLEVCPSVAAGKPRLEVHPLGIGGKAAPARLLFDTPAGDGVAATIVDMGGRFRMIVNDVKVIPTEESLPKLPVANALWKPMPNLEIGAEAWILAGGTHHTSFSMALTSEYLEDYAEIAGIEMLHIDKDTTISNFKKDIKLNEVYYLFKRGF